MTPMVPQRPPAERRDRHESSLAKRTWAGPVARIALACLLLSSPPLAPIARSAEGTPCASATTQIEINECAAADFKAADGELNAYYRDLIRNTSTQVAPLRKAQQAWIAYRDADCAAEAGRYQGGSAQAGLRHACLAKLTRERIAELKRIYEPN